MSSLRNRWFHAPTLHSPVHGAERKVGWLELFYDLIFVATIIQLGNALAADISLVRFLAFVGLFTPIWTLWTGFTFFSNRFVVDDFTHRFMVFAQMFAIGTMAISVGDVLDGDLTRFALAYAAARFMLAAMYFRTYKQVKLGRALSRRWALLFTFEAALWGGSVLVPAPWNYLMWAIGLGSTLAMPIMRVTRDLSGRYPPDILHMSERYGLLTIIVLGESFVKVLSILSETGMSNAKMLFGALTFTITASLWWVYFDDVAGSRLKRGAAKLYIWVYAHLPLTCAVTAVGVAIKKVVLFDAAEPAGAAYRWFLCGTLAMALLSVALIDTVTERRQAELSDKARVNVRVIGALCMLLFAPTGAFMPAWAFVMLITAVCGSQVIIDLMMAPEEADAHDAEHDAQLAMPVPEGEEEEDEEPKGPVRRDISEAVRKGTPSELRRDLYFFFMEGSWWRLWATLLCLYVFVNIVFAALFMLEPGSIANADDQSFLDAFFFSVQTMSTIGYGTMTPDSLFGDVLVTVEAAIGLLGVALATGVMFAKASRPQSSVLFVDKVLITTMHGNKTLMFRLGNARGNAIVDAHLSVAVLLDEESSEGHTMRRLHDLKLHRSNSPVFSLTWTVMHDIDEQSPLHNIDWNHPDDALQAMVVTMTGHDDTYAQTTHARHVYYPEDFRTQMRYVDILSTLDDGRFMVDYNKFHKLEPLKSGEDAEDSIDPVADAGAEQE